VVSAKAATYLILLASTCVILGGISVSAKTTTLSKRIYNEVTLSAALEKLDCNELWKLIFPELKRRNTRAIGDLIDISYAYYFRPPGLAPDRLALVRSLFIWSVYSLNSERKSNSRFASDLLQDESLAHQAEASSLQFCLQDPRMQEKESVDHCRAKAIEDHIIPAFDDFIQEFHPLETSGVSDSCLLRKRDGDTLKKR
jgi:hypothetical protein